jgi:DNA-binding ferritin-like protein (Dps family)
MFKEIIKYIKNSNLQYIEKEEALHQIMDIILQAQAEQKSADVIIGGYEASCKSIIEEYTKDKSTVYTVFHHFLFLTSINLHDR